MHNAHAFLSCSSANSWVRCAAYPRVSSKFPDDDNNEAKRGTAAHWVLETALLRVKQGEPPGVNELLDTEAPNGVNIDSEIVEGVCESLNEVYAVIGDRSDLWATLEVELRIHVTRVHGTECWGTADIVIFDYRNKHMHVIDFKFGHVYVEPWENWQLMLYAMGALDKVTTDDTDWNLTLSTLQPRCYTHSKSEPWSMPATELRSYGNTARIAAENALSDYPLASTGKHCKYCPGRHACAAYTQAVEHALEISCLPQLDIPSPDAVSAELSLLDRALDILKSRRAALGVQAEVYLKEGKDVGGYSMQPTRPRLKWFKKTSEVLKLGDMLGVDLKKPSELITPNQAINKGIGMSVVNRYAKREPGGVKLTLFDSLKTKKAFSRVKK